MTGYDSPEDQRPLTYFNGHPIYATTLLVIVHVFTMVLTALSGLLGYSHFVETELIFRSRDVLQGHLWQAVTYAFVNGPSLWFAIDMLLLFRFGREVEQFLGRRAFLRMYGLLVLLGPAVFTLLGLFRPVMLAGSGGLHFAVFVAFAALYPNVEVFFGVAARWVALVLFAIYTLIAISAQSLTGLISLWVGCSVAVAFIWHQRGWLTLPSSLRFWKKQPQFHVVRDDSFAEFEQSDALESINPLLDKISKSGLASLTRKERAALEKAREALLKKESHRG
jgi:membrane associated rhomboid family serine protease